MGYILAYWILTQYDLNVHGHTVGNNIYVFFLMGYDLTLH